MNATVNFSGDAIIHITGINSPKMVSVHNNQVDGSSPLLFYSNVGNAVSFDNNRITGSFTDIWDIDYNIHQTTSHNIYNGYALPDLTARDAGTLEISKTTSGSPITINLIKINANEYDGCSVNAYITITAGAYNQAAVYTYAAYAGNNSGSVFSSVKNITRIGVSNNPAGAPPEVNWSGSTNKTLTVSLNTTYTGYQVSVKIAGWRLKIKGA
jgi:hypothetical protein